MNYFTEEAIDWEAPPGRFEAASSAYREHLAQLWPGRSPEVRALAETDLHDGLIRQIVLDVQQGTLILRLRCGCLQTSQGVPVGYFDLDLHYHGVELSPAELAALREAAVERGTEVLYNELDRQPNGVLVHRLLCIRNEYRELTIRFQEVDLVRTAREQRRGRLGWPRHRFVESK